MESKVFLRVDRVFVRSIDLPAKVHGVTVKYEDDFYVFINSCLCSERQKNAVEHEIRHIKMDHFYNSDPVIINEIQAMDKFN